ncbi:MAG: hypothetical protein IPK13_03020 [Deltaproteobacteria bacterium]|nr:hypothetical protein [Deltaproteobacteria bacterium]
MEDKQPSAELFHLIGANLFGGDEAFAPAARTRSQPTPERVEALVRQLRSVTTRLDFGSASFSDLDPQSSDACPWAAVAISEHLGPGRQSDAHSDRSSDIYVRLSFSRCERSTDDVESDFATTYEDFVPVRRSRTREIYVDAVGDPACDSDRCLRYDALGVCVARPELPDGCAPLERVLTERKVERIEQISVTKAFTGEKYRRTHRWAVVGRARVEVFGLSTDVPIEIAGTCAHDFAWTPDSVATPESSGSTCEAAFRDEARGIASALDAARIALLRQRVTEGLTRSPANTAERHGRGREAEYALLHAILISPDEAPFLDALCARYGDVGLALARSMRASTRDDPKGAPDGILDGASDGPSAASDSERGPVHRRHLGGLRRNARRRSDFSYAVQAGYEFGKRPSKIDIGLVSYGETTLTLNFIAHLSSQEEFVGTEGELKLGWSSAEPWFDDHGSSFVLEGGLRIAGWLVRAADGEPVGISVSGGIEGRLGGRTWWSTSPRWAPVVGARGSYRVARGLTGEAEYMFLPRIFGGKAPPFDLSRLEHRVRAFLVDNDSTALGLDLTLGRTSIERDGQHETLSSTSIGVVFDWRGFARGR